MKQICFYFLGGLLIFFSACVSLKPYETPTAQTLTISKPTQVVDGHDKWSGPEDCSANIYVDRQPEGLLITVEVTDDVLMAKSESLHQNDGIELYIDMRPYRFRGKTYYSEGVFKIAILPKFASEAHAVEYYPESYPTQIPGLEVASKVTGDHNYTVQVFIPEEGMVVNNFPIKDEFRFDVGINDADADGMRESQLMWAGKADNWSNPSNFGSISFK